MIQLRITFLHIFHSRQGLSIENLLNFRLFPIVLSKKLLLIKHFPAPYFLSLFFDISDLTYVSVSKNEGRKVNADQFKILMRNW